MTDNTENRIRLAEAMGWTSRVVERDYPIGGREMVTEWTSPDRKVLLDYLPFHPFTDANDCDALIRHLVSLGYRLCIEWVPDRRLVVEVYICTFSKKPVDDLMYWKGDDYKQGVCELALKVLDNE